MDLLLLRLGILHKFSGGIVSLIVTHRGRSIGVKKSCDAHGSIVYHRCFGKFYHDIVVWYNLNQGLTEEAIFQSVRVICSDLNMPLPSVVTFGSLLKALQRAGFRIEAALGFGYYPLPPLLADLASRIDPVHAHHMGIKARKPA